MRGLAFLGDFGFSLYPPCPIDMSDSDCAHIISFIEQLLLEVQIADSIVVAENSTMQQHWQQQGQTSHPGHQGQAMQFSQSSGQMGAASHLANMPSTAFATNRGVPNPMVQTGCYPMGPMQQSWGSNQGALSSGTSSMVYQPGYQNGGSYTYVPANNVTGQQYNGPQFTTTMEQPSGGQQRGQASSYISMEQPSLGQNTQCSLQPAAVVSQQAASSHPLPTAVQPPAAQDTRVKALIEKFEQLEEGQKSLAEKSEKTSARVDQMFVTGESISTRLAETERRANGTERQAAQTGQAVTQLTSEMEKFQQSAQRSEARMALLEKLSRDLERLGHDSKAMVRKMIEEAQAKEWSAMKSFVKKAQDDVAEYFERQIEGLSARTGADIYQMQCSMGDMYQMIVAMGGGRPLPSPPTLPQLAPAYARLQPPNGPNAPALPMVPAVAALFNQSSNAAGPSRAAAQPAPATAPPARVIISFHVEQAVGINTVFGAPGTNQTSVPLEQTMLAEAVPQKEGPAQWTALSGQRDSQHAEELKGLQLALEAAGLQVNQPFTFLLVLDAVFNAHLQRGEINADISSHPWYNHLLQRLIHLQEQQQEIMSNNPVPERGTFGVLQLISKVRQGSETCLEAAMDRDIGKTLAYLLQSMTWCIARKTAGLAKSLSSNGAGTWALDGERQLWQLVKALTEVFSAIADSNNRDRNAAFGAGMNIPQRIEQSEAEFWAFVIRPESELDAGFMPRLMQNTVSKIEELQGGLVYYTAFFRVNIDALLRLLAGILEGALQCITEGLSSNPPNMTGIKNILITAEFMGLASIWAGMQAPSATYDHGYETHDAAGAYLLHMRHTLLTNTTADFVLCPPDGHGPNLIPNQTYHGVLAERSAKISIKGPPHVQPSVYAGSSSAMLGQSPAEPTKKDHTWSILSDSAAKVDAVVVSWCGPHLANQPPDARPTQCLGITLKLIRDLANPSLTPSQREGLMEEAFRSLPMLPQTQAFALQYKYRPERLDKSASEIEANGPPNDFEGGYMSMFISPRALGRPGMMSTHLGRSITQVVYRGIRKCQELAEHLQFLLPSPLHPQLEPAGHEEDHIGDDQLNGAEAEQVPNNNALPDPMDADPQIDAQAVQNDGPVQQLAAA